MHDRTPGVLEPTALVISRDESLVEEIKGVQGTARRFRFEVCQTLEQARAVLGRDAIALMLFHLPAAGDEAEVAHLLDGAAVRLPCDVVILSDVYQDPQAAVLRRAGAADYLGRPIDHDKLACLMDILVARTCPAAPGTTPAAAPAPASKIEPDVFQQVLLGPDMMELMEQLRRVVPQDTTLLLTGETGTGKTRLARLVHELSPRREEPFLVVDCGALSTTLIESELFGHVKGAFTGADRDRSGKLAAAGKGTLLLDEVNSLPLPLQTKLLRAVDERVFEPVGADRGQPLYARIMATSNAPLEAEVAAGRFRADLFYRLNIVSFYLPPLRERRAAVASLARKFLAEFAARNRPDLRGLAPEAVRALEGYSWPGNVRQLRNVIEQASALCPGPDVLLSDLPDVVRKPASRPLAIARGTSLPTGAGTRTLAQSKAEAEVLRINEALRKHGNNRVRAAAELGISRMSLYKKLQKYGLMCITKSACPNSSPHVD
jgi:DNA-binding NtrC family response regulator